jgi:hypothetical protein
LGFAGVDWLEVDCLEVDCWLAVCYWAVAVLVVWEGLIFFNGRSFFWQLKRKTPAASFLILLLVDLEISYQIFHTE